jgi:hypothetical protein
MDPHGARLWLREGWAESGRGTGMEQLRLSRMDCTLDPASIDRIGATLADVLGPQDPAEAIDTSLQGVSPNVLCCLAGALGEEQHRFVERDGELLLIH